LIGIWIFSALVVAALLTLLIQAMDLGGAYKNYYCYKCKPPWYSPNQNGAPICSKCGEHMEEYKGH